MSSKNLVGKFLDIVEKGGNKLPDPLSLFFILSALVLIFSFILSSVGVQVTHPADGSVIVVQNLLNGGGIQRILGKMVNNFATFPPFAVVLVSMLGIGVADKSGLIAAALKKLVTVVPSMLLPATLVFAGIMSNVASDAGYIVLTPLGAVLFAAFGRHPIAGLTAAFAGVSGGFSANLLLSSLDPLMSGLSTQAAQLMDPSYVVLPTANYYFMVVSTFLITIVGALVTSKIVEPRLGKWQGMDGEGTAIQDLTSGEKKGLIGALIYALIFSGILLSMTLPEKAILRDDQGELKPFYDSIVPLIMVFFMGAGIIFGLISKTIKSDKDINSMLSQSMAGLGSYIVLAFIAAQFVAYFSWSNIGIVLAIKGAGFLKEVGLTGVPLMMGFIMVTAILNLFMGSASAKWAIMAPVFVPMFMMMGYSPRVAAKQLSNWRFCNKYHLPVITLFSNNRCLWQKVSS
jgi:aminobenzoyl-glutamate transport protein